MKNKIIKVIFIIVLILSISLNLYFIYRDLVSKINVNSTENEIEKLDVYSIKSTILILNFENTNITSNNQIKYQKDYSSEIDSICKNTVKDEIYSKYGMQETPLIETVNNTATMYSISLKCERNDIEKYKKIVNEYCSKINELLPQVYNVQVTIVDLAGASK